MGATPFKLAIVAGEVSGDNLGADLISAVKRRLEKPVELVGVGGPAMIEQGLKSIFDFQELSIIGYSAVLSSLPRLAVRIRSTIAAIVAARPDVLVIIDSPAFTHRVAAAVRKRLPDLPIVNYVCPTVWAWKPERAQAMTAYVDHVLAVYPFEKDFLADLGGPPLTYVGHRLANDPSLLAIASEQAGRRHLVESGTVSGGEEKEKVCLILPGSRKGEVRALLPDLERCAEILASRTNNVRFVIPTLPRIADEIERQTKTWSTSPEVVLHSEAKNMALARADAAIAASGTVLLELALAGIPCVSIYRLDGVARLLINRVTAWTAALPNFIADYPVVNEYINESLRPGLIARRIERLIDNTAERNQMLRDFDLVRERMRTDRPSADLAAEVVCELVNGNIQGSA
ncbi:lipid-A-disaccharide synthase [Hoeflea sp. WL0058]|uniref:Lipid-A-disaccharide synthase n=1 Tax=Flavimaribacter sediminis TaxID=2865987 RepID=A0AAE2ZQW2_9HYPH|nr:lipid-A-disaccharide synthase [Flavimaribacter sediminis]MBW8640451.1 lipid-A-disaccharide synthase [Flavimaribacter sediminis]